MRTNRIRGAGEIGGGWQFNSVGAHLSWDRDVPRWAATAILIPYFTDNSNFGLEWYGLIWIFWFFIRYYSVVPTGWDKFYFGSMFQFYLAAACWLCMIYICFHAFALVCKFVTSVVDVTLALMVLNTTWSVVKYFDFESSRKIIVVRHAFLAGRMIMKLDKWS